jgi:hypothetical protein
VFSYKGKPTGEPAGDTLTFTSGDPTLATMTVAADGNSASFAIVEGAAGTYTYSVADATGLGYSQDLVISAPAPDALRPGLTTSIAA